MKIRLIAVLLLVCVLFSSCSDNKTDDKTSGQAETTDVVQDVVTQGEGLVPESTVVDESYFDDAAFVGDSISLKLNYYNASTSALGKAQFFTSGSLGAANSLWDISDESVHPSYQGTKTLVEDCVMLSGAKKVFIMFGMNDIGLYGLDDSIENYKEIIGRIKEKSPDAVIFVQSMTPITASSPRANSSLNNTVIKEYNEMLLAMCEDMGWYYLDVASALYDDTGEALKDSYCSDLEAMGMHFSNEGCHKWVDYLKTHAINAEEYPESTPEAVG